MNKVLSICLSGLLVWGLGCKKEVAQEVTGTATAVLGAYSIPFDVAASARDSSFSFTFILFEQDLSRLELYCTNIPKQAGAYTITAAQIGNTLPDAFLLTTNGDNTLDNYTILSTATNTFAIAEIDDIKHEVSGTFDLTFYYDARWGQKRDGFPDTLRLQNGVFRTPYNE